MKRSLLVLLGLALLLTGCLNIAWRGYKKPLVTDFERVNTQHDFIRIGKQNLTEHQWQAIREAASDVCDILADPEFRQRVVAKTWLASCGRSHGKPDTISGEEVYRLLMLKTLMYSVHPHKPWKAIAQAEADDKNSEYNKIAITPSEIESWFSPFDTVRSGLINIIAHETIHIVSEKFLDYDARTPAKCHDADLVSYGVADLAEEIWLAHSKK